MLTSLDIDTLFAPLKKHARVGLAVSGGGDSIALMLLAREWAQRDPQSPELIVVTVDHCLRPESGQEAEWVAAQSRALGLPHEILTWQNAQPDASQAEAREARYTLMADFACAYRIGAIVTAHTADDVAETFLMRLARGSGVDGLAAMASETVWDGVSLHRPLLGISRAQLRAELEVRGAAWLDDPSNADTRFERVRVRQALDTLAELGISRARIVESAERLQRARAAIDAAAGDFIRAQVKVSPAGYVRFEAHAFRALPDEVGIHALKRLLWVVGGGDRPPRLRKLEMLARDLRGGLHAQTTLAGAVISPDEDMLVICREPGRLRAASIELGAGGTALWDRRFRITCGDLPRRVCVTPLGERNLPALPAAVRKQHPAPALATLPALYAGDQLLGVPVHGFALADQRPEATCCIAEFIWSCDGM